MFEIDPEYVPLRNQSSISGKLRLLLSDHRLKYLKWILIVIGIALILIAAFGGFRNSPVPGTQLPKSNGGGHTESDVGIKTIQSDAVTPIPDLLPATLKFLKSSRQGTSISAKESSLSMESDKSVLPEMTHHTAP